MLPAASAGGSGPNTALLTAVRATAGATSDQVVFEFSNLQPGHQLTVVTKPIHADPSDAVVPIAGNFVVQVRMEPASGIAPDATPTYTGPTSITVNGASVLQVVQVGDFEDVLTWDVGLTQQVAFTASTLADPNRLVVDVRPPVGQPEGRPQLHRLTGSAAASAAADLVDLRLAVVGVGALLVEQRGPIGVGLGRRARIGAGERLVHAVDGDELGPLDERVDHRVLGHDLDDLALHEQVTPMAAGGDAEIGLAGLAGTVHDATHDRDLDGDLAIAQGVLGVVGHLDDVDLGPPARGTGDEVEALALAQAHRLEQLAPGPAPPPPDRR